MASLNARLRRTRLAKASRSLWFPRLIIWNHEKVWERTCWSKEDQPRCLKTSGSYIPFQTQALEKESRGQHQHLLLSLRNAKRNIEFGHNLSTIFYRAHSEDLPEGYLPPQHQNDHILPTWFYHKCSCSDGQWESKANKRFHKGELWVSFSRANVSGAFPASYLPKLDLYRRHPHNEAALRSLHEPSRKRRGRFQSQVSRDSPWARNAGSEYETCQGDFFTSRRTALTSARFKRHSVTWITIWLIWNKYERAERLGLCGSSLELSVKSRLILHNAKPGETWRNKITINAMKRVRKNPGRAMSSSRSGLLGSFPAPGHSWPPTPSSRRRLAANTIRHGEIKLYMASGPDGQWPLSQLKFCPQASSPRGP